MLSHNVQTRSIISGTTPAARFTVVPDLTSVWELTDEDRVEVLAFLGVRPVHTVVMSSFIYDNGLESELNRGRFYGYRGLNGVLEGVALIGHSTLVEARSHEAMSALSATARTSRTPIHLIMSSGTYAEDFWQALTGGIRQPRLRCDELLFELSFPLLVRPCEYDLRLATEAELQPVAEAQAEVAFIECGVDPMVKDREGFMKRVARRIEQERVFVVVDAGRLLFKADIIAETTDVVYLEGIYVAPESRGRGIGSQCLAKLGEKLLERAPRVCLLSNIEFVGAHKTFLKAGFRHIDQCTTLFT